MPTVTVQIVNAFVDGDVGGNPAGLVLDAESYDRATRQAIARAVGLSETAFVSPSSVAAVRLEFFTPTRQVAHCGHATIAAFGYLAQHGLITGSHSSKETIDGVRDIILKGELAFMAQSAPRYTPLDPGAGGVERTAVLASLGLETADLLPGYGPMVVSTGANGLMVPLRDAATVRGVEPDVAAVERLSAALDLVEYYVFSPETRVPGRDAGARMFAPLYGIPEEAATGMAAGAATGMAAGAATGMAAGALACYLHDHLGVRKDTLLIEQGYLMPRPSPSVLIAELDRDGERIGAVRVGGRAIVSGTREVALA
jgi:PhzF family phenazine biosynthesis protein